MLDSRGHDNTAGLSSPAPFAKVESAPELNQLLKLRTVLGFSQNAAIAIASRSLVAYAADAVVMIWDWTKDKQICLKGHKKPVISLRFTPDGHYLLSADGEEFLLWACSTFSEIFRTRLYASVQRTKMDFTSNCRLLITLTVGSTSVGDTGINRGREVAEHEESATICVWDWIHGMKPIMKHPVATTWEEPSGRRKLLEVKCLPNSHEFITVTSKRIKFWSFKLGSQADIYEKTRSLLSSDFGNSRGSGWGDFTSVDVSDSGLVFLLCIFGRVLVLDNCGHLVTSFRGKHDNCKFNSISVSTRNIVIGTELGTVEIWRNKSLIYQSTISYQQQLRENLEFKATNVLKRREPTTSKRKYGPSVNFVYVHPNCTHMIVSFDDRSLVLIDLIGSQIVRHRWGHFGPVMAVVACPMLKSDPRRANMDLRSSFITAAGDQSLILWTSLSNTRYTAVIMDMPRLVDESMSYIPLRSSDSYRVERMSYIFATAVEYHPYDGRIAVGDSHGQVRVFDIRSRNMVSRFDLSGSAVISLSFNADGSFLLVHRLNGEVTIVSTGGRHRLTSTLQISRGVPFENQNFFQKSEFLKGRSPWQRADPILGRVIGTTYDPKTVSLRTVNFRHQLSGKCDVPGGFLPSVEYHVEDGQITGVALHPSEEYVLIATCKGVINIFTLLLGERKGVIDIGHPGGYLSCDPSGLYIAISASTLSNECSIASEFVDAKPRFDDLSPALVCDTILIYEFATGRYVGEISGLVSVCRFCFSADGGFLYLASSSGVVSVYKMPKGMYLNIKEVCGKMRTTFNFWQRFPLNFTCTISSPIRVDPENDPEQLAMAREKSYGAMKPKYEVQDPSYQYANEPLKISDAGIALHKTRELINSHLQNYGVPALSQLPETSPLKNPNWETDQQTRSAPSLQHSHSAYPNAMEFGKKLYGIPDPQHDNNNRFTSRFPEGFQGVQSSPQLLRHNRQFDAFSSPANRVYSNPQSHVKKQNEHIFQNQERPERFQPPSPVWQNAPSYKASPSNLGHKSKNNDPHGLPYSPHYQKQPNYTPSQKEIQQLYRSDQQNYNCSQQPIKQSYATPPRNLQMTRSEPNYMHQGSKHNFSRSPQFVPSKGTSTFDQYDMQHAYGFPNEARNLAPAEHSLPILGKQAINPHKTIMSPAQGFNTQFQQRYPQPWTPAMGTSHPEPKSIASPIREPHGVGDALLNSYGDLPVLHSINKQIENDISVEIGVPTELSHGEDMNNCLDHFLKKMWEDQKYKEASLTVSEEEPESEVVVASDKKPDFVPKNNETKAEAGPSADSNDDLDGKTSDVPDTGNNPDQKTAEQDPNTQAESTTDPTKKVDVAQEENLESSPQTEKVNTTLQDENVNADPQAVNNVKEDPKIQTEKNADHVDKTSKNENVNAAPQAVNSNKVNEDPNLQTDENNDPDAQV